jgi:cation transport ATPase
MGWLICRGQSVNNSTEEQLLSNAKTLEEYSLIANAVVEYATQRGISSLQGENFKSITGKGVQTTIQDDEIESRIFDVIPL